MNTGIHFEQTKKYVTKIDEFYDIDLTILQPEKDFFNLFEVLGFPSRRLRWCCDVLKFAPMGRFANDEDVSIYITGTRAAEHKRRK